MASLKLNPLDNFKLCYDLQEAFDSIGHYLLEVLSSLKLP